MTSNPSRHPPRRNMRPLIAVTLFASDVNALVNRANIHNTPIKILYQPHHERIHIPTSLNSIGDPERNSDKEKRFKERKGEVDGSKRQRRRNANGKYPRRRQSQATDEKTQMERSSSDSKAKEKIRTSGNNSLKQFSTGSHKPRIETLNDATMDGLKKRVIQLESLVSSQMSEMQKLRREMDEMAKTVDDVATFYEQLQAFVQDDESQDGNKKKGALLSGKQQPLFEDDLEIFGIAPTTIKDAADSAGQSILSAILAGKHRMLVDVRDAELTRDPSLLAEFIELAVLPVAAGLQGLDQYTNRVKIIFPKMEELLRYRKSMALTAPEVMALSTLGFDPIEEKDNLVVIVAPSPDDTEGCDMMKTLLETTGSKSRPVVVINHHMMPMDAGTGKFTVVYHLRLLSVQYMTGDIPPEYVGEKDEEDENDVPEKGEGDSALEAAMTHARESGVHQGVTRAMVIRAYPKPWHVFVDVSPDTDADFEVAATFDSEPSQEDVNYSIVECLEGSEREDELVAKQMQAALDAGQLTRVSEMLGIPPNSIAESIGVPSSDDADDDSEKKDRLDADETKDWDDLWYDDWLNEDSV